MSDYLTIVTDIKRWKLDRTRVINLGSVSCVAQICRYCRWWFPKDLLTIDHVIPRSAPHVYSSDKRNWVLACRDCNVAKGHRWISVFTDCLIRANRYEIRFQRWGRTIAVLPSGLEIELEPIHPSALKYGIR